MIIAGGLLLLAFRLSEAISAYWTPILPSVCSPSVPKNISTALHGCDRLMDKELANIFDFCVRSVHRMAKNEKLDRPKLCYYSRQGMQLDRCKMMKYRAEGITLLQLVEREQDHTWCLMKIAQPLGWERLCSDTAADWTFVLANQEAIQDCETRFLEITTPIRECFKEEILDGGGGPTLGTKSILSWNRSKNASRDRMKPAACLSFQYSKKIWKCLAKKDTQQTMQRRANMYISCLRSVKQDPSLPMLI